MHKTALTIADLKIGEPLILGSYSVLPGRAPAPIVWLKASPNNDFITASVIDYCSFERTIDKFGIIARSIDECQREEIVPSFNGLMFGLPTIANINHDFTLFKRKGKRANGTVDILNTLRCRRMGFTETSYLPFWVSDTLDTHAGLIDRMGKVGSLPTNNGCGFRPICKLNAEAKLCVDDNGIFYIDCHRVYTDEELCVLLGIK